MNDLVPVSIENFFHGVSIAPQGAVDWGVPYVQRGGIDEAIAPMFVLGLSVVAFIAFVWIRARARVQEKRIDLLRELASRGQLSQRTIDDHLMPRSPLWNIVFVAAWFGLIGGVVMFIAGFAGGWRREYEDIGLAGIVTFVFALATITAPIALREIRRQNAG